MNDTGNQRDTTRRGQDLLAFDRVDRIGLVLVLALAAVGSATAWVVVPALTWATGGDLRVPFFSEVTVPPLDAAGIRYDEADYLVHVADATTGQWLLHLVPGLGFTAVVLRCAALLVPVVRDLGRGDPFAPANVRRLRVVGLLLLVAWPVLTLAQSAAEAAVIGQLDLGGLGTRVSLTLPLGVMLAGLVAGLVAEAFAAGSRLRDDVDGLV